jgi:hypothetical protein
MPTKWTPSEPGLLKALDDAAHSAARENVRFAMSRLQLRGGRGEIIGTDGKLLLVQNGLSLPWKEDVLVPALRVFAAAELPPGPMSLSKTDTHIWLRVGPWTFGLTIDKDGRYPDVSCVIPAKVSNATTCRLTPEDDTFLSQTLSPPAGRRR